MRNIFKYLAAADLSIATAVSSRLSRKCATMLGLGVVDVAVVHSVLHTARAEGDVVVHHPRGAVRLW